MSMDEYTTDAGVAAATVLDAMDHPESQGAFIGACAALEHYAVTLAKHGVPNGQVISQLHGVAVTITCKARGL